MNADEHLKLLREIDSTVDKSSQLEQIEAWKKKEEVLFKMTHAITVAFGGIEKIETGSYLQDANYWAEIEMTISRATYWGGRISIRLSNEGDLITIIDEQHVLNNRQTEAFVKIFRDHGYCFVPAEILQMEYGGAAQPCRKEAEGPLGKKWFDRFFDY